MGETLLSHSTHSTSDVNRPTENSLHVEKNETSTVPFLNLLCDQVRLTVDGNDETHMVPLVDDQPEV